MLFGIRLTVVNAYNLSETKFRHEKDLKETDIVLVFNGQSHFFAAGEHDSGLILHDSGSISHDSAVICTIQG